MKYFLRIRFLGTRYRGYQVQKNGPTVQAELNRAAEELFGFPCDIVGCSRTDSGVHAEDFCITVTRKGTSSLETEIPPERIPVAMNAHLPPDIAVFSAQPVPDSFHPRYDVKEKEYCYRIYRGGGRNPFYEGRSVWVPGLDDAAVRRMDLAAGQFIGTFDFRSYMAEGSKIKDTVRTVTSASVVATGDLVEFRISADGFLYHMVRIMAGTLLAVAEGKLSPEEIPLITAQKDRTCAGRTAPACGLYLHRVTY